MPTQKDWEDALSVPRKVLIESSASLVTAVQAQQQKRAAALNARGKKLVAKAPTIFPDISSLTDIDIRPIDLLHAVGKTTVPMIPNLADICSWWAYVRYLWAFSLPKRSGASLRLSDEAREIDFHQKALLSDEIGVGMAAYIMAAVCGAPQSLDVDVALRRRLLPVRKQLATSPDYIFFDAAQTKYFVVECKGTQTRRHVAIDQIRRGMEQVPSLAFTNGRSSTSLVVATYLAKQSTKVLVVDPPNDDPPVEKPIELSNAQLVGEGRWQVRDWGEFAAAVRKGVQARLLAFAGDDASAVSRLAEIVDMETRRTIVASPPQIHETAFGEFEGVEDVLPTRDGLVLEVFRGVERRLLLAARSGDENAFAQMAVDDPVTYRPNDIENGGPFAFALDRGRDGKVSVSSVSPEGTMLRISIRPR